MSIFLTPNAENDFIQLTCDERQCVANVLVRTNPLNIKKLAGMNDLHRIRVGALRLVVKRTGDERTILRMLRKPETRQYFANYRTCIAARHIDDRVPLSDSVIGKYIHGQTPVGMIESIEERTELQLSDLRGEADALRKDIGRVRESIQFLELCSAESGQNVQRIYDDLRDEFVLTLESIEERVVSLESPRRVSFPSWFRSRVVWFISTCLATCFRSSAERALPARQ